MVEIYIRDKDTTILNSYKADVIPRVGEIIYSTHMGGFRVVSVVHVVSDTRARCRSLAGEVLSWIDVTVEKVEMER